MGTSISIQGEIDRAIIRQKMAFRVEQLDRILFRGAKDIEAAAIRNAPVNNGQLKQAIATNSVQPFGYEVVVPVAYAPAAEFGTKRYAQRSIPLGFETFAAQFKGLPGMPRNGTLWQAIAEWMKDKGLIRLQKGRLYPRNADDFKFLWGVVRKIRFNGRPATPFLIPAYMMVTKEIEEQLKQIQ